MIFQRHNFLSSASTWELEDWQRWIDGASRMRYNTEMIYAYGNNPMLSFSHNGQTKPAGYLVTTRKGGDWGAQHVNDVRRLAGGSVFQSPEFGSSAALVPDERRVEAAQALTGKALAYARRRGLHVAFALDVDTESANPQNVILTLPKTARFTSGGPSLPNPDAAGGYAYFKAQAQRLFELYPQIDRLVIWFRAQKTPWRDVKPEAFPAAWRKSYAAAIEQNPAMKGNKNAPSMFAIGRITAAFSRALKELGRQDVEIGCRSWRSDHPPAAHVFFEPGVKLYWLDWNTSFNQPDVREKWLNEGRMFGRETTDRCIDVPLNDAAEVAACCRERLEMLDRMGGDSAACFRDYEKFTAAFFETHAAYERALALHKAGNTQAAREAIRAADPQAVIEQYVKAASRGRITRGEQALVVSLNLRRLPYIVSLRQALGMEPARYKFGPTQQEPVAQGAGRNTFWIDSGGALWKVLGEKETGVPAMETSGADELCTSGIRLQQPLALTLASPMGDDFAPVRYRYTARIHATPGRRMEVELRGGKAVVHLEPTPAGAVICGLELSIDGPAK